LVFENQPVYGVVKNGVGILDSTFVCLRDEAVCGFTVKVGDDVYFTSHLPEGVQISGLSES